MLTYADAAGSGDLPAEDAWCVVDVMNFKTTFNYVLFEPVAVCVNPKPQTIMPF
jgi:hypothetical protein